MSGTLAEQLEAIASRLANGDAPGVQLDRPRNPDHGDLATNLAMVLAGRIGQPPRAIAQSIIDSLDLSWTLLKLLPADELTRVTEQQILEYGS